MILKRIELNGFKSFADKTSLVIEPGVTGIVGPNGSGKSNIADAIRWVLGEQSSKNLRGVKMEDVIFSGTVKRPRKAFCEVALVFDNQNGQMQSDYTEIVISRKMFRSGESEYYINKNLVRLKDILDIIRDTGIGKEGYSIVGQGRIDEILASKPAARRKVFEEAAGIMKYRVRKEEAERKLERTAENLVRVEDILEELKDQLLPLEEQMERTKSYLAFRDELREIDVNLFLYNYEKLSARAQKLREELAACAEEGGEAAEEIKKAEEEIREQNQELEKMTSMDDEAKQELSRLTAQNERLIGEHKVLLERIESVGKDLKRLADETQASDKSKLSCIEECKKLTERNGFLIEELTETEHVLEELAQKQETLKAKTDERAAKIAELKQQHLGILTKISDYKSEISAKEALLARAKEQREDLLSRRSAQEDTLAALLEKERALAQENQALAEQSKALSNKINETSAEIAAGKEVLEKREQASRAIQRQLQDTISKKKLLSDLKAEYEGYSDSVKNLFRGVKQRPELKKKIMGTFAELIKVPPKYETAIELLLGAALQNIVVQNEQDAKELVSFLHENRLGRITFLPLEALRVNYLSQTERACLNHPGFLSIASEAVEYDAKIAPAVDFLLARTVIVEDMDSAIAIMKEADYSFRAVTLKGDIVRPGGTITGGSVKARQFGLLSRERQIGELSEQIAGMEKEAQECLKSAQRERDKAEALERERQVLLSKMKETEVLSAQKRQALSGAEEAVKSGQLSLEELERQIREGEKNQSESRQQTEELQKALSALGTQAEEADRQAKALEQTSADSSAELGAMLDEINNWKIKRAELVKEREAVDFQLERLEGELARFQSSIQSKQEQIAVLTRQQEEMQEEERGFAEKIALSEEAMREAGEEIRFGARKISEKKEALAAVQKKLAELQATQAAMMERKYKTEAQIEKVKLNLENAQNKIWEDYELTYAGALEYKKEISYMESVRRAEELREEIRSLGPINPTAIEDYNRVSERVGELTVQQEDLNKAREDLYEVIDRLMAQMRGSFREKFDRINENFKKIFADLFGGGNAEISLGEGDIMECGIEISAQPPGKKLQHISLLSGGERALTAIALLFAMLRINPSPVCLLDEIDAPLDEANVVRYSSYLSRLDENTQFLVITHRKPTMSVCDVLYGVAMEEKGVSKLVSVSLKEGA